MNSKTREAGLAITAAMKEISAQLKVVSENIDTLVLEGYLAPGVAALQGVEKIQDGMKEVLPPLMMIGLGWVKPDAYPDNLGQVLQDIVGLKDLDPEARVAAHDQIEAEIFRQMREIGLDPEKVNADIETGRL